MKRFLLVVIALFAINTMVQAQSHKVGDIVVIGNEVGVVFFVTPDGQHGKAMSVSHTRGTWGQAKTWCAQYGRGWRLPKKDELKIIYSKKEALNSALTANGYEVLGTWCWSSEEYYSDCAWLVTMTNGDTHPDYTNRSRYARAVSAF